ncbi:alpha/beta fold hydrolase [Roseomonas marmotae]|uniref:Alpha/beta hydrolase n=1 Tax=Roseomonas marmotae TaxID=2768161 RepID=A0ABS3KHE3_9PROT|nr:alpha/beta hydrolase [Roseomonas marmotae]MBO1076891.1 alpha/beta hydrolase [Roseomonas marmotae]QTI81140.1 alpha/beta hydrolase [Roseomonas marmotae]
MTTLPTQAFALPGGSAPRRRGYLRRPDCRVYYEATGSGPALVFAHGLGGNHMSWWQQVAHFAATHCCVTFSHRGFAPSDTPPGGPEPAAYAGDLEALIAHLELKDPVVIGQSMGGWTGIDLALSRPGLLKALVLSATSGPIDPRQTGAAGAAAFAAWSEHAAEALREGAMRGIHPAIGLRAAEEQPALHFLYRAIDELSAELDKETLRRRLIAGRTRPASDLSGITIPTLWITGAEDVVFPSPVAPYMAAAMPHARHISVEKAGHSPYFERPATFNTQLAAFLASLSYDRDS